VILVSPTEPLSLVEKVAERSGKVCRCSSQAEQFGADFLFRRHGQWVGVQRKRFPDDLLASVQDGRLVRETILLRQARWGYLIVEGVADYTSEGYVVGGGRWTRRQVRNYLRTLAAEGLLVEWSRDEDDTAEVVAELYEYHGKKTHRSHLVRPAGGERDSWGRYDLRAAQVYFLQGLEGIGPALAERIVDHFGGVPLRLTCTEQELCAVPGIGKGRATRIVAQVERWHGGVKNEGERRGVQAVAGAGLCGGGGTGEGADAS